MPPNQMLVLFSTWVLAMLFSDQIRWIPIGVKNTGNDKDRVQRCLDFFGNEDGCQFLHCSNEQNEVPSKVDATSYDQQ